MVSAKIVELFANTLGAFLAQSEQNHQPIGEVYVEWVCEPQRLKCREDIVAQTIRSQDSGQRRFENTVFFQPLPRRDLIVIIQRDACVAEIYAATQWILVIPVVQEGLEGSGQPRYVKEGVRLMPNEGPLVFSAITNAEEHTAWDRNTRVREWRDTVSRCTCRH